MNQQSVEGDVWRRRWYVLTNRALICYENHLVGLEERERMQEVINDPLSLMHSVIWPQGLCF